LHVCCSILRGLTLPFGFTAFPLSFFTGKFSGVKINTDVVDKVPKGGTKFDRDIVKDVKSRINMRAKFCQSIPMVA
jgi:hypothetical protein